MELGENLMNIPKLVRKPSEGQKFGEKIVKFKTRFIAYSVISPKDIFSDVVMCEGLNHLAVKLKT